MYTELEKTILKPLGLTYMIDDDNILYIAEFKNATNLDKIAEYCKNNGFSFNWERERIFDSSKSYYYVFKYWIEKK